jgi:hypothetical protein
MAQISTILDIVIMAIKLQKYKQVFSMEDTHVLLKGVFCNQNNKKIILNNITYPRLLRNLL